MKNIFRALTASAVLFTAPAFGQVLLLDVNTSVPLAATLDNPCTPEPEAILFQGTTKLAQRVWLLPNGNVRLQVAEDTALQGSTAAPLATTGVKYTVAGASSRDVELDPVAFEMLVFKKVAREWATDNFHTALVMAFDPQNVQLKLGLEAYCDDGRP